MRHSQRSASLLDLSANTLSLFSPIKTPDEISISSLEFMKHSGRLKPVLIQAIEEVIGELETVYEDVARGAREHIHSE
jgi:translation initiation factor eIF-2B subunit beta